MSNKHVLHHFSGLAGIFRDIELKIGFFPNFHTSNWPANSKLTLEKLKFSLFNFLDLFNITNRMILKVKCCIRLTSSRDLRKSNIDYTLTKITHLSGELMTWINHL